MRRIPRMCYPVALAAALPLTVFTAAQANAGPSAQAPAGLRAAQDPASCPEQVSLVNGGFEVPVVTGRPWAPLPDASQGGANSVPGWRTTATDHVIELWTTRMGVPPAEGGQFAELNANQVSTLYQDRPTTPGQKLYWRLSHRGRLGTDTMALDIGDPAQPVKQATMSDGNGRWGAYSGTYTVPAGQTTTRFAFHSVSAAGGNPTFGNLLDDIFFGTPPCVIVTKSASPQRPVNVGDVITYRLTAVNKGGGAADDTRLTDTVPPGTTFVPGSLQVVDGPNAGAKTDQAGDDQAEFDPATGKITFTLGDDATAAAGGRLPDSTTVEFQVRVGRAAAGGKVTNRAVVDYENRLGTQPEPLTSTSGDAVTEVNPAVDLSVVKAAEHTRVSVGGTVTYQLAVRNAGPNDATGVVVKDALPAGLTLLSATPSTGVYAGDMWTVGTLAAGDTATLTVRAKATAVAETINTATVSGKELDLDPSNDSDSVKVCVDPAPDCPYCTPPKAQRVRANLLGVIGL
ncbi:isopeptide-forming domain-containing fimbrial protein [Nonomuraea sp. CA-141351]|uniref:isopeptide-forming domain-containing fimbrial protein n=1 Tax=Nonomuraea sp. CA-141351 TaxID=3239996 RepID=UPI003D94CD15